MIFLQRLIKGLTVGLILAINSVASAHSQYPWTLKAESVPVMLDTEVAQALQMETILTNTATGVSIVRATPEQLQIISMYQHANGRCGGFKIARDETENAFSELIKRFKVDSEYDSLKFGTFDVVKNPQIAEAIKSIKSQEIYDFVKWFSGIPTRFAGGSNANEAVMLLKEKVENLMKGTSLKWQTQLITHSSVNQKSLRLTLTGSQRPSEIVVIGGHLDSIADWGMSSTAPGADDNASGSGSIFEALRVLKDQPQPERTIEFYWYGGEELGLLGSEDIANQYKAQNKNVIAVLQLDMTAYKGEGDNVIGSAQDFTSGFLRDYLLKINDVYGLGLKIVPFKCGYGCSDHASWYSEGYPTLMPFESTMASMNRNIHTRRDTIDLLNFTHAAHFSKIALVFAMDFGNSTMKESN